MRRIAALDIGTNTILLLLAEGPPVRVLADEARIVRLGEGVDRTGRLAPAAVTRALAVLGDYAARAHEAGAEIAAVGTQALREVQNADVFLEPARAILGVPVEVVDGEREALLAWRAVRASFPELAQGEAVVMDVGGGSTEFVLAEEGSVRRKVSVPIGSVRLQERFVATDPPRPAELAAVAAAVDQALLPLGLPPGRPLAGIAGTVTTLAAIEGAVDPYDPERVHGAWLERAAVERQIARLAALPLADRRRVPGLEPARADVIVAGALVVARAMAALAAPRLRVSDRGVRWGLLLERLGRR